MSDSTELINKLELLHKMKEEGKLSDEEYNIMKNKVIAALTGKVFQTEPETKRNSDEAPIKMQDEEIKTSETPVQKTLSEDTGPTAKIEQLNLMKEKGMISEEEFNSMKSKILLSMIENKELQKSEPEHSGKVESPVNNKVQKEDNVSSSSSQSYQPYQTCQTNDSKDKLQISKKVIYSGVALVILVLGFVFVYPKLSQEDDPGITKLAGYFSNDNDNKKEEKDNNDLIIPESKNIEKKEIGKTSESIIYEATNGKFSKMSGTYRHTECNETVGYEFFLMDLNDDNIVEVFQIETGSGMCFGKYGCEMNSFFKNAAGFWDQTNNWIGCYNVKKLSNINKGYHDIQLANGPIWRWNGKEYEFLSKNEGIAEDNNKDNYKENYENNSGKLAEATKGNENFGKASDIVTAWIESLGKRDFQAAYDLMTPSLSKGYDAFTSTSRYGGITKTLLHSSETVSSSGCNYVVIASYDSYDPYNRDGKFTERFYVNNCNGVWQITNIRNVSVEYYR